MKVRTFFREKTLLLFSFAHHFMVPTFAITDASFIYRQPSIRMDKFMLKFPHLFEQMFRKLNNESLFKSREVARSWQYSINERNYPWLCVVNIPTILQNRNTYLYHAVETGQMDAFKIALSEEDDKNIKNLCSETSFYLACHYGHLNIVEFLLEKTDLNIDINATFQLACDDGSLSIVKFLLENTNLNVDFNARDNSHSTGYVLACLNGHTNVAKEIMENYFTEIPKVLRTFTGTLITFVTQLLLQHAVLVI